MTRRPGPPREEGIALPTESQSNGDRLLRRGESTGADHIEFLISIPARAETTVRSKGGRLYTMP